MSVRPDFETQGLSGASGLEMSYKCGDWRPGDMMCSRAKWSACGTADRMWGIQGFNWQSAMVNLISAEKVPDHLSFMKVQ